MRLQVDKLQSLKELILKKDVQLLQVMTHSCLSWPSLPADELSDSCCVLCGCATQDSWFHIQVFLPELVVLQADPAASVRKFLPEFLETCPSAALPPPSLSLVLQCLQGLLQDSVPAVVKATIMASSNLFRTALAVVVGQVWSAAC